MSGQFGTVQQLMDAVAVALGDREAYVDGDQRVTFGDGGSATCWVKRLGEGATDIQRMVVALQLLR